MIFKEVVIVNKQKRLTLVSYEKGAITFHRRGKERI